MDYLTWCLVVLRSGSVFYGKLDDQSDDRISLREAREIYHYQGVTSHLDLASRGLNTSYTDQNQAKMTGRVASVRLFDVASVYALSKAALESFDAVPDMIYPSCPSAQLS
jgi:hypothetical protein